MSKTYTEFAAEHAGKHLWTCRAGCSEDGRELIDVLVYETEEDLCSDDDNSLAVDRATVVDDRQPA